MQVRNIQEWFDRTPNQTFVVCPLTVLAFELVHAGELVILPWGCLVLAWGYLQYLLVGRHRLPRAGGSQGMQTMPERIITTGPYSYTRNPMYLGHLIFLLGLGVTFWSWFAMLLFAARAIWFHRRVLHDEQRLEAHFDGPYIDYRRQVKRWIPGIL